MTARDIVMSAAGSAGDSKTYIEDVFSTYLYTGNGSTQTINNGIDLAGKGGMVWAKVRNLSGYNNHILDTVRGRTSILNSDTTSAAYGSSSSSTQDLTSFNSNGFSLGTGYWGNLNDSGNNIVSWTFRKAPKFFDVVTYTGDGNTSKTISHSLGTAPGMMIVKSYSESSQWIVYHRSLGATKYTLLNLTDAAGTASVMWNNTEPTASNFTVGSYGGINALGSTYVAYLFAHDTTTDGLIQCGSYTGNGSASGPVVTLGWEPQYLMIKNASGTGNWFVMDVMRGMPVSGDTAILKPNTSEAEDANQGHAVNINATGFQVTSTYTGTNGSGNTYIYMAIRRGPMRTPTDATKVFKPVAVNNSSGTVNTIGFPVDMQMSKWRTSGVGSTIDIDRLRSFSSTDNYVNNLQGLIPSSTEAEQNVVATRNWSNTGFTTQGLAGLPAIYWNFRRAPGFFDVVCYTGTGSTTTQTHNLGVAPELIIIKRRDAATNPGWAVGTQSLISNAQYLVLNSNAAPANGPGYWGSAVVTASTFPLGSNSAVNYPNGTFVAYLFATCPGVSKVFSFTGNGSSQTINCGFTNGARLVLIKRTDSIGDWYVWDTARGIVAGNDPHLSLNTTAAEVTTDDTIDPDSTGFIVNQVSATDVNVNGASYIGLAIA